MSDAPTFRDRAPASRQASAAARGSSNKRDTSCEIALRQALRKFGLRYRVDVASLAGRPDIVFGPAKLAVFCDGDFWHGRDLPRRMERLSRGHNAPYWVAKIQGNVARDRRNDEALARDGWLVIRVWEGDIKKNAEGIAERIAKVVRERREELRSRRSR